MLNAVKSNKTGLIIAALGFVCAALAEEPGMSPASSAPAAFSSSSPTTVGEPASGSGSAVTLGQPSVAKQEDESPTPVRTVLREPGEFNAGTLMSGSQSGVSGFSLTNPNRFSMHQSYSVNFASGSVGTASSGVYLNTLSYRLADPLTLSADVGFYSPLYATGSTGLGRGGIQDPRMNSSLIFPHVGLEYRPTENTTFSLHLFNGQDAVKAYGSPYDPFVAWPR